MLDDEWEELEPPAKTVKAADTDPVRLAIMRFRNGGRARARIYLHRTILAQAKFPTYRAAIGIGKSPKNRHKLAIRWDEQGKFEFNEFSLGPKPKEGKRPVLYATLAELEQFPDVVVKPMGLVYGIADKLVIADLPPFCWDPIKRQQFIKARSG